MVTISNGRMQAKVTRSAYEEVFKKQGFNIINESKMADLSQPLLQSLLIKKRKMRMKLNSNKFFLNRFLLGTRVNLSLLLE